MRRSASEIISELEMRVARLERQSAPILEGIDLGFKRNPVVSLEDLIKNLMDKLKRAYPVVVGPLRKKKKISNREWATLEKEIRQALKTKSGYENKEDAIIEAMGKLSLPTWNLQRTGVNLSLKWLIENSDNVRSARLEKKASSNKISRVRDLKTRADHVLKVFNNGEINRSVSMLKRLLKDLRSGLGNSLQIQSTQDVLTILEGRSKELASFNDLERRTRYMLVDWAVTIPLDLDGNPL